MSLPSGNGGDPTPRYQYGATRYSPLGRASIPARAGAWFVDTVLVSFPVALAFALARFGPRETRSCSLNAEGRIAVPGQEAVAQGICEGPTRSALVLIAVVLLITPVLWLVFQLREGHRGASIGKELFGLRLVDRSTGLPIGGGRAVVRNLVRALGIVVVAPAVIDHLWPLWDRQGQTIHDKAVDALVVPVAP